MKRTWFDVQIGQWARVLVVGCVVLGLMALSTLTPMEATANEAKAGGDAAAPPGVIGVSLHVGAERVGDPAVLYIAMVHPEGPAHAAGLTHGDEVVAVDGQGLTGKTYEQVALMIRGEVGTTVKLSVKGEGGARDVSVPRVSGESLYKKGDMGQHGGPSR